MNRASSLYAACQHTYHCIATATREGNERNHSIGIHARYPPVRLVWLSCRPSGTHLNKPSLSHRRSAEEGTCYMPHRPTSTKHIRPKYGGLIKPQSEAHTSVFYSHSRYSAYGMRVEIKRRSAPFQFTFRGGSDRYTQTHTRMIPSYRKALFALSLPTRWLIVV